MDVFLDGGRLRDGILRERTLPPESMGPRTGPRLPIVQRLPRIFEMLDAWLAQPITSHIIKAQKPRGSREPPLECLCEITGEVPTIVDERPLLEFSFLRCEKNVPVETGELRPGVGQQMTRIQRYSEQLERRHNALIDAFISYATSLVGSLFHDLDTARRRYQDFIAATETTFSRLATSTISPAEMDSALSETVSRVFATFDLMKLRLDKLLALLQEVVVRSVQTLAAGLAEACCTEEKIHEYIDEIVRQVQENIHTLAAHTSTFVTAAENRAHACVEDGRAQCVRVILHRKLVLVQDILFEFVDSIHKRAEFSPTLVTSINRLQSSLHSLNSECMNFVTRISITTEHPRDLSLALVRDVFFPRRHDIRCSLYHIRDAIEFAHSELQSDLETVAAGIERVGMLDPEVDRLLHGTVESWRKRWDARYALLNEVTVRTLHATSFFIASTIAIMGAVDTVFKHATLLEERWQELSESALDAIEARFTRDWTRASGCLTYIKRSVENIWATSDAEKVKKISATLLDAVDEAIRKHEQAIINLTSGDLETGVVIKSLISVVSAELYELCRTSLMGSLTEEREDLLKESVLGADLLICMPSSDITTEKYHELDDSAKLLIKRPTDDDLGGPSTTSDWACTTLPLDSLSAIVTERSRDIEFLERLEKKATDQTQDAPDLTTETATTTTTSPTKATKTAKPSPPPSRKASRSNTPVKNKEAQPKDSGEPELLIPLPTFETDVDMDAYYDEYGFSYYQDGFTPDRLFEAFATVQSQSTPDEKKGGVKSPPPPAAILGLTEPGEQQFFLSHQLTADPLYACAFLSLPKDIRFVFYFSLLLLLHEDGRRVARNEAIRDFGILASEYRTKYLELLNERATAAYKAELAAWEKGAGKRAKPANPKKPKEGSRPETADDGRPQEPEPIVTLPEHVEKAISSIAIPEPKDLSDKEVYARLVYAIMEYDSLKLVPLFPGQKMPQAAPVAQEPPAKGKGKPDKAPVAVEKKLLRPKEKSPEAQSFEDIISNPVFSLTVNDIMFDDLVFPDLRPILDGIHTRLLTSKCLPTAVPTSQAGGDGKKREPPMATTQPTKDPDFEQQLDELCMLSRPAVRMGRAKPVVKRPDAAISSPPSAGSKSVTKPPSVLGSRQPPATKEIRDVEQSEACFFEDCRLVSSPDSIYAKMVLSRLPLSAIDIQLTRLGTLCGAIIARSLKHRTNVVSRSEDLRTTLVPYRVKLLTIEQTKIGTRASRYIGIEQRAIASAYTAISDLRQKILDSNAGLKGFEYKGMTEMNRRLFGDVPSASPPSQSPPPSGNKATRAKSATKQAPPVDGLPAEAVKIIEKADMARYFTLTFSTQANQVTALRFTDELGEKHPLFRFVEVPLEHFFYKPVLHALSTVPAQASREIGYAADAFITECRKYLRLNYKVLGVDAIQGVRRNLRAFLEQARSWSGRTAEDSFDFTVADVAVTLLRDQYDQVVSIVSAPDGHAIEHPAIATTLATLTNVDLLEQEFWSRLETDLTFFRRLTDVLAQAVEVANRPYASLQGRIELSRKRCGAIKGMIYTRLARYKEMLERLDQQLDDYAVIQSKTDINAVWDNAVRYTRATFEVESLLYALSYNRPARFVFYGNELQAIGQAFTYFNAYELYQQRCKAHHAHAGALLGMVASVINILCAEASIVAEPFTYTTEVATKSSPRGKSPHRRQGQKPATVTCTVAITPIDIKGVDFSYLKDFAPQPSNYKAGMKLFYTGAIESDLMTQLSIELSALRADFPAFSPKYQYSPDELQGHDGMAGDSVLSNATGSTRFTQKPQPMDTRIYTNEEEALQIYYWDLYEELAESIQETRAYAIGVARKRDALYSTIVKQFAASACEVTFQCLKKAWDVFRSQFTAEKDSLLARFDGFYAQYKPILVKMPDHVEAMREGVTKSLDEYAGTMERIIRCFLESASALIRVAMAVVSTVPATLLGLYPSRAGDQQLACCASLQAATLLEAAFSASEKKAISGKEQGAAAKAPKTPKSTEPIPAQSGSILFPDPEVFSSLMEPIPGYDKQFDACVNAMGKMMRLCEAAYVKGGIALSDMDPKELATNPGISGKDAKTHLNSPALSSAVPDFQISDFLQLEVATNSSLSTDPQFKELSTVAGLTQTKLFEILAELIQKARETRDASAATPDPKGKKPDTKKAPTTTVPDTVVTPQPVLYITGAVTFVINEYVEIFNRFLGIEAESLSLFIPLIRPAVKLLLLTGKNTRKLCAILADNLKTLEDMRGQATSMVDSLRREFKEAFEMLADPATVNAI
ncbi:hypothetical protein GMRT_12464 [Giardia muris]|uniref:Uncharacterized protein n=1 Tax=Giardia muris TaxID=5742 RepID=A0A4Z1SNU6_GIAMU|nr:hypothetical protein GMRT_12464 [Giardia muris]|eukprot:TNJ27466.1 hypothetical protein GMRT_12464 [Giardia muris]